MLWLLSREHVVESHEEPSARMLLRQTYLASQRQKCTQGARAWRIEFSCGNIRDYWARLQGRVRGAAPQTRPFNRAQ